MHKLLRCAVALRTGPSGSRDRVDPFPRHPVPALTRPRSSAPPARDILNACQAQKPGQESPAPAGPPGPQSPAEPAADAPGPTPSRAACPLPRDGSAAALQGRVLGQR